jgi:hypothetical protein
MAIEYRLFYRPASADELKKRKIKGYTVTTEGEYLCHAGLKTAEVVNSSHTFVPHSSDVALRLDGGATGSLDVRVVVKTDDKGMEKIDKNADPLIVESELDADVALEEAGLGKIPRPGATVEVRRISQ